MSKFAPFMIAAGCAVGGFIILALLCLSYYNSLQTAGVAKETAIVAQNNANTATLNGYAAGLTESVGIANLKSDQMDKIITDAVKGRYTTGSTADPNNKGTLFSAIHEAYPTIDLSVYDKIVSYVQAKRDEYVALQTKLQDQVRDFSNWRKSGQPHSFFVGLIGFPDNTLRCQNDDGNMLYGKSCEDYLLTISQPNGSNNGRGQSPIAIPGLPTPAPQK